MYKQIKKYNFENNQFDGLADAVLRVADNATIPFAEANTDYQAFLRWCEEGNTPLPAETN